MRWTIVIPVKARSRAKSRLALPEELRRSVAEAIALDTIAATAASGAVSRILVVTDDEDLARAARALGADSIREHGERGPNQAVGAAMKTIPRDDPRASLLGDLPALHPEEVTRALSAAGGHARAVVADADRLGSTLVTAAPGMDWLSAFGHDSLSRHRRLGLVEIPLPAHSGIRRDVDTLVHLHELIGHGRVGPRTRKAASVALDSWPAARCQWTSTG